MKTFYFNTGVDVYKHSPPVPVGKGEVLSSNGIKLIPFDCADVPEGATFEFACDNPGLHPESDYIVREIHNSTLHSKYAYFRKPYKP